MYYSTYRDDHYVRVCAIKFLCLLDETNTLHKKFIEDFFMTLLDKVRPFVVYCEYYTSKLCFVCRLASHPSLLELHLFSCQWEPESPTHLAIACLAFGGWGCLLFCYNWSSECG